MAASVEGKPGSESPPVGAEWVSPIPFRSREDGLGDYQLEYPIPALRSAGAPLSLVRSLPACG